MLGKHSKRKLSPKAEALLASGSGMMSQILQGGGTPMIVIGSKAINKELSQLDYMIASPLSKDEVLYVLTRVIGLIDGTIHRDN